MKYDISSMLEETTIYVFHEFRRDRELSQKLACKPPTTLASLFQVSNKYSRMRGVLQHISLCQKGN
jgi:hypothetical protein